MTVEGFIDVVWWFIIAAFSTGGLLALWRMVKGPTIVDRMVASDTILTISICLLGAEMVYNGHIATLPFMLVLAMTAFIAPVAVARYVSRQDKRSRDRADADPETAFVQADGQVFHGLSDAITYDRVQSREEARQALQIERAPRAAELRETEALEAEVHGAEEGHDDTTSRRGGHDDDAGEAHR